MTAKRISKRTMKEPRKTTTRPVVRAKTIRVKAPKSEQSFFSSIFSMDNAKRMADKGRELIGRVKGMNTPARPAMRKKIA